MFRCSYVGCLSIYKYCIFLLDLPLYHYVLPNFVFYYFIFFLSLYCLIQYTLLRFLLVSVCMKHLFHSIHLQSLHPYIWSESLISSIHGYYILSIQPFYWRASVTLKNLFLKECIDDDCCKAKKVLFDI